MLRTNRIIRSANLKRRTSSGEGGFTLLELLIVIVVLGILSAVVVFALGGVTAQAAVAACNADAKTVETAISAYNAQTGGTPTATASSLTSGSNPYLHSFPSSSYYTITVVSGAVMVAAPSSATPAAYDTANPCGNAGSSVTTTTAAPVTTTTVAPTTTTTTPASNGVAVSPASSSYGGYGAQERLNFTNTNSITAMTVTITVPVTTGITYNSAYNSFPGGALTQSYVTSGGSIVYTTTLNAGQTIPANYSSGTVAAQYNGTGGTHPTSTDTWSVTTTSNGTSKTVSGTF